MQYQTAVEIAGVPVIVSSIRTLKNIYIIRHGLSYTTGESECQGPGAVMTIHTFGNHAEKFYPHIHAIVSDSLFRETGTFYVMPDVDLKPLALDNLCQGLEDIFRASVFKMLKDEGKINDDTINRI